MHKHFNHRTCPYRNCKRDHQCIWNAEYKHKVYANKTFNACENSIVLYA